MEYGIEDEACSERNLKPEYSHGSWLHFGYQLRVAFPYNGNGNGSTRIGVPIILSISQIQSPSEHFVTTDFMFNFIHRLSQRHPVEYEGSAGIW